MNHLLETLDRDCCCLCESYYWTTQASNRKTPHLASDETATIPSTPLAWLSVGALATATEQERQLQPLPKA